MANPNAKKYNGRKKKYDDSRKGQRTRNWTAIFYPNDLPADWMERIDGTFIRWVSSPLHDQDVTDTGDLKKVHYHALFIFDTVKTQAQVSAFLKELFGTSNTGTIIGVASPQSVGDRRALVRYMAHMDSPEKAQYDPNQITGHNGVDVYNIIFTKHDIEEALLREINHFIIDNDITEFWQFILAIEDKPGWSTFVSRKAFYFDRFISSYRYSCQAQAIEPHKSIPETLTTEERKKIIKDAKQKYREEKEEEKQRKAYFAYDNPDTPAERVVERMAKLPPKKPFIKLTNTIRGVQLEIHPPQTEVAEHESIKQNESRR